MKVSETRSSAPRHQGNRLGGPFPFPSTNSPATLAKPPYRAPELPRKRKNKDKAPENKPKQAKTNQTYRGGLYPSKSKSNPERQRRGIIPAYGNAIG